MTGEVADFFIKEICVNLLFVDYFHLIRPEGLPNTPYSPGIAKQYPGGIGLLASERSE